MFNELNNNKLQSINYLQYRNYFEQQPLTQTIVEDSSYHVSSQYDRLSQLIQKSYQDLQISTKNMQKDHNLSSSPSHLNQHKQQFVITKEQQNHNDRQLILQGLLKNWQYRHQNHQTQTLNQNQYQYQYPNPIQQSTVVNKSVSVSSQNNNNSNNNHQKYQYIVQQNQQQYNLNHEYSNHYNEYYNMASQKYNQQPNNQSPSRQYYNFVPKHSTIPVYQNNHWLDNENNDNKHVNNSNNFHIKQRQQVKQQSFSQTSKIQRPGFIKQQKRLNHGSISSLQSYKPQQHLQQQQKYNQFVNNGIIMNHGQNLVRQRKQYRVGQQQQQKQRQSQKQQQQNNFYQCIAQKYNNNLATTLSSTMTNNLPTSNLSSTQQSKNHPVLTTTRPDSSIPQDNFEDSLQRQHLNPNNNLKRQYEQDLFQFIKQQLIRVTIQNRQLLLIQSNQLDNNNSQQKALNKQKNSNRQLYNLYKQSKESFYSIKQQQQLQLQSLQKQIKILTQQLVFYKQQSTKISTSMSVKLQKQQELYFNNKVNLQNILIKNNQVLSELNSQLQQRRNKRQQKEEEEDENVGLNDLVYQNNLLKQQLLIQQQMCNNQFKKLITISSAVNQLQLKKQQHLNQLFKQLAYAKHLASYRLSSKKNNNNNK